MILLRDIFSPAFDEFHGSLQCHLHEVGSCVNVMDEQHSIRNEHKNAHTHTHTHTQNIIFQEKVLIPSIF